MPALPKNVVGAVDKKRVKVYFADRTMTKYWNERRSGDDLRFFGGWYWYVETNGRATETENGPYKTESAAYRDAFLSLELRRLKDSELTTQIRGSGVVKAPVAATQSVVPMTKKQREEKAAKAASKKRSTAPKAVRRSVGKKLEAANANSRDAGSNAPAPKARRSSSFGRSLENARKHLATA